ncbi:MAG: 30S ribosomal protein S13 [Candidatus Woesearchaeota archaeon]
MAEQFQSKKKELRNIVRIVNTDLDGDKKISFALTKIKGVSYVFANAVLSVAGIDRDKTPSELTDVEISKIEEIIRNPEKFNMPSWLLNRRKDYETGKDMHLLSSDLDFTVDSDIKRLKKIKSNRGLRHAWNLPVRGQRTKSNFRRNKGKVTGVKRKK